MLLVKSLTKKYKDFTAVDNISFDVKKGEIFGMLGPNGAGKSTLMKMLNGFIAPTSGDAFIDGISINELKKIRKLIGWVPQEDSFYDNLTVIENINYFGSLYKIPKDKLYLKSVELAKMHGIDNKLASLAKNLSGGMKKRLSIAIALIHEPKLLFMDEPTVGVDPISRNSLFDVIEEIKKKGITIIYTSHYLPEIERLCDRVGIMKKGKLLMVSKPQELKKKYSTLDEAFINIMQDD